jgi:predicted sulfurtransferase
MTNLEELRDVIQHLHGGIAVYRESVPVKETWKGQTVWDGVVEVFDLHGHPKTDTAYAWSHETDDPENPRRHVAVLHIPPAISPRTAVQTALVQEYRNANPAQA